jgi:hypothetical protein
MNPSKNSLGLGKNNHGRMSGARSSRASSTIFKKLQKLDRQISKLQNQINPFGYLNSNFSCFDFGKQRNKKLEEQIKKLDLKRKEVRLERKKYNL